jgi:phosphatidylcholine synthase
MQTSDTATDRESGRRPSTAAAVAVHVYTSLGSVLAFLMIVSAVEGRIEVALWLFLAAMVVDGTDGLLARRLRVKEATPWFDGALLDNIVDYLTYCFAPVVLLWAGGYLPEGWTGWVVACLPLLASSYQFCRSDAKTDDHFFLGFPSYWNIVAFYVVVAEMSVGVTVAVLAVCTVLVFVPVKYVYPSRTATLWHLNMAFAVAWLAAYAVITALLPDAPPWLVTLSLAYPAYYLAVSLWLTASTRAEPVPGLIPGDARG